ncbi:MAG: penicillin-binding protein, partial [Desulfatiglandales bacterium]
NKSLASQTVGFVNIDNRGVEGIEKAFDFLLMGPEKKVVLMKDATGKAFAVVKEEIGQKKIHQVSLTIDRELQQAMEEALKKVVLERRAISANAVLMDSNTGEILAMATYPSYDPNNYGLFPPERYRNRSITDVYEPGSVMKPFVFALALEKGAITPSSLFHCENGKYPVAGKVIKDVHPYGTLTAEQVIVKSSNIGASKIGDRVGYEEFYRFMRKLGFGTPLGIELPGERSGFLRDPKRVRRIEEVNTYFGQGVTVTTLQMVAGMATLVNGGYVVKPHLVREIRDEKGAIIRSAPPSFGERVLSGRTSDIVKGVLEKVTEGGGTGSKARVPMYSVGGKTGTAQKVDPILKTYAPGRYISSFIGFAPADYPRFVLGVVVDEPKGEYYGGVVAAPVFSEIASVALARMGLKPDSGPQPLMAQINKEKEYPSPMESCLSMAQQNVLPDFRGMPIREVLNTARLLRVPIEIKGSGFAVKQDPRPGTGLNEVRKLFVEFHRPNMGKGG